MNKYMKNLNRIEFVVTMACTGRCKHCSEGEHISNGEHISGDVAAKAVHDICGSYDIKSIMTFGGELLLCPENTLYKKIAEKVREGVWLKSKRDFAYTVLRKLFCI